MSLGKEKKMTLACLCALHKDDLILCSGKKAGPLTAAPPASPSPSIQTVRGENDVSSSRSVDTQNYTDSALKELYQQVTNMPESAKKKKLIRQVTKVCREANGQAAHNPAHACALCLRAVWKTALVDAYIWFPDAFQQEALALALFRWNDKGKTVYLLMYYY